MIFILDRILGPLNLRTTKTKDLFSRNDKFVSFFKQARGFQRYIKIELSKCLILTNMPQFSDLWQATEVQKTFFCEIKIIRVEQKIFKAKRICITNLEKNF